jgi:hypothetical protein
MLDMSVLDHKRAKAITTTSNLAIAIALFTQAVEVRIINLCITNKKLTLKISGNGNNFPSATICETFCITMGDARPSGDGSEPSSSSEPLEYD